MTRRFALAALLLAACSTTPRPVVLVDDGGWCWFQDERAIVRGGEVVFGSVASGRRDPARRGDVQVSAWDLESGAVRTVELHDGLELDDHAAPALLELPDGRVLAAYSRHGGDDLVRTRRTIAGDVSSWEPERTFDAVDDGKLGATYSNLFLIERGAGATVLDFVRGDGWDPNVLASDDLGLTWRRAGRLSSGPGRPYVKYASDGRRVHFVCTEQHPRDFDNSLYHGVLDGARVLRSDGTQAGDLSGEPVEPAQLTRVFQGAPDAVAWPCDVALDSRGNACVLFSIQKDGAGLARGTGGADHRFGFASFDDERWVAHEIAFAGTRLYAGEDDYTGLAAFDPDDVATVYISTDADPRSGAALASSRDGRRHRELFRGVTHDGGAHWSWHAITRDSTAENLRPIVPARRGGRTALLWLRGELRSYTDFDLEIVGLPLEAPAADSAMPEGPHGWPLVYRQGFDAPGTESDFDFTDARVWRRTVERADGRLEQFAQSQYTPRHRSPLNLALLRSPALGDFVLEARLRQTGREYPHRDMCVVFAYRDAEHFHYAHLASAADDNAHHVQRVDGAPRTPVTTSRSQGVDWSASPWLPLRVERVGASVRVWLGDAREPQLAAELTAPGVGRIGFGTFDDTGAVDDIRIWAPRPR